MQIILYIVCSLLILVTILFAIAAIRAAMLKRECTDGSHFDLEHDSIAWQQHVAHLSAMLQVPTVSERGNPDKTQIYAFHKRLEELYPLIHSRLEKHDIDGALLFKWAGRHSDRRPILLMSHMDVVEGGDEDKWKYPPFSGTVADGRIWGRGSVDTKGALCAILESVEHLLSEGFTPYCDVYIASSCNEEITGDGAVKTVEYLHSKGITLDLVMDEGGSVMGSLTAGSQGHSAMIGIFEKGRANIKFTAASPGGHASVPFKHNPFARLARLIDTLERGSMFKKKLTAPVRHMYNAMVPYMAFPFRFVLGNLWLFGGILPFFLGKLGGRANALVSTTCVFTQAQGSHGANVIPQHASVTANMRFMIHEGLEKSYHKVAKLCHKLDISMEMLAGFDYSPTADMNTYAYKYVEKRIAATFGDIPIIPYVMLAGTDARHYTKICSCVLRFVPLSMTSEQLASAHAINENLNVDALARGVVYYVGFLRNYGE